MIEFRLHVNKFVKAKLFFAKANWMFPIHENMFSNPSPIHLFTICSPNGEGGEGLKSILVCI